MPQATLSASRVARRAGQPIGAPEWGELLFASKAEFKALNGEDELVVEATADRLDLLCDGGLGTHLAGALDHERGALPLGRRGKSDHSKYARAYSLGDPLDDPAFAGRVSAFEENNNSRSGTFYPKLQFD